MRRILFTLALVAIVGTSTGCCGPACSTGWNFSVGKPASISTQTVLGPQVTTYAGQGLVSGPVAYAAPIALDAPVTSAVAPTQMLPAPRLAAKQMPSSTCTMDDVCKKLDQSLKMLAALLGQSE